LQIEEMKKQLERAEQARLAEQKGKQQEEQGRLIRELQETQQLSQKDKKEKNSKLSNVLSTNVFSDRLFGSSEDAQQMQMQALAQQQQYLEKQQRAKANDAKQSDIKLAKAKQVQTPTNPNQQLKSRPQTQQANLDVNKTQNLNPKPITLVSRNVAANESQGLALVEKSYKPRRVITTDNTEEDVEEIVEWESQSTESTQNASQQNVAQTTINRPVPSQSQNNCPPIPSQRKPKEPGKPNPQGKPTPQGYPQQRCPVPPQNANSMLKPF
ncbi:MAG: hypothetical protein ACRC2T_09785, partial [Thermoguttaceae bacterium]